MFTIMTAQLEKKITKKSPCWTELYQTTDGQRNVVFGGLRQMVESKLGIILFKKINK